MRTPSTGWREQIAADEEDRFKGYAEQFIAMQKAKSAKLGNGRALHRKQLTALRARLDVLGGLPAHAAHGLFARPASYEARVRLSNGGPLKQADREPDIRGFAIKALEVSGQAALGGPAKTQDFLLINRPAFSSPKSDEFVPFVMAAAKGPLALVGYMIRRHGFFAGLGKMRELVKSFNQPFSGFACEPFFSAAPIACGPYAARVRLLPASDEPTPDAKQDWAGDLYARLAGGELVHELQLQFYVDESVTPIEDASVDWPESEAPYLTVARLTLPRQQPDPALQEEAERTAFDPWNALVEHRPLGDVMRARKVVYYASETTRGAVGP